MSLLRATVAKELATIRRNPVTWALVLLTSAAVVSMGVEHGRVAKAIAYLLTMALGIFVVDLFTAREDDFDFPVRTPNREAAYVLISVAVGCLGLFMRFVFLDWDTSSRLVRLAVVPLFACVFPIALVIVMLALRYTPRDLGLRWCTSAFVFLPVVGITAAAAYAVAPQDLTLKGIVESEGVAGAIFSGLILAGASEEFLRLILQTRIGAVLGNKGMGWFSASVLWALMHVPKAASDSGSLLGALMSAVRIVPIGLLWGYMTHRTKSFVPALLAHGFNVWGLQNS